MCKRAGLDRFDLQDMTIGMCLDFVDEYIKQNSSGEGEEKVRQATQKDFDSF